MKNFKIAAIIVAAALLVLGATMTANAAAVNWTKDANGVWYATDANGDPISNRFLKDGNDYFYVNEDGAMLTDQVVTDDNGYQYYVDENGARVSNVWKQVTFEDTDVYDDYEGYMFFQSNGKAATNGIAKCNGTKYLFDTNGRMCYGWVNASYAMDASATAALDPLNVYYCGDKEDGKLRIKQWEKLTYEQDYEEKSAWFFFTGTGVKQLGLNEAGVRCVDATYGSGTYFFATTGAMLTGWVDNTGANTTEFDETNVYLGANGKAMKGWIEAYKPGENANTIDAKTYWYYKKNDGTFANNEILAVSGKQYAFNEDGQMITGLAAYSSTPEGDGPTVVGISTNAAYVSAAAQSSTHFFFFGNYNDGSMKTGVQTVSLDDGDNKFTFKFYKETASGHSKGQDVEGRDGNSFYTDGKLVAPSADQLAAVYEAEVNEETGVVVSINEIALTYAEIYDLLDTTGTNTKYAGKTDSINSDEKFVVIGSNGVMLGNGGTKTDWDGFKFYAGPNGVLKGLTLPY